MIQNAFKNEYVGIESARWIEAEAKEKRRVERLQKKEQEKENKLNSAMNVPLWAVGSEEKVNDDDGGDDDSSGMH